MNLFGKKKVGLALGGGAVLGACHIGALRALEEREIAVDCVSGTSIGALVGAFYAFGMEVDRIEEIALNLKWMDLSSLSLSRMGLLSNDKLGQLVEKHLGKVEIEEAERELSIVATDLSSGEKVEIREGDLATAVMASTCIPGIFEPVQRNGRTLVDGGLVENVPINSLKVMGAEYLIAVDINAMRLYAEPDDIIEVVINALDIAIKNLTEAEEDEIDLLIRPHLASYSRTDNDPEKIRELIERGYQRTIQALSNQSK